MKQGGNGWHRATDRATHGAVEEARNEPDFDVLIVGAGLSGLSMAAHLARDLPYRSYAILERRDEIGGTWDLFRYPGVRSDSDMHTLGFAFEPWTDDRSIADAPAIRSYLARVVDKHGIGGTIRLGHTVRSASFDSSTARWTVEVECEGARSHITARWLYLGSGYYDYDEPHDAGFDLSAFRGTVVHPQFWPDDFDYAGKDVVVIGSGATAVTIVPAMAQQARSVTMLQRTPTWMFGAPAKDRIANVLRALLGDPIAYRLARWKNIRMQALAFRRARRRPEWMKRFLTKRLRKRLESSYAAADFTPPYDPWDQRICLVPDHDLFDALKAGDAQIATGRIAAFEADGIGLEDGRRLPADIIVTATGLKLELGGKIAVSVDGEPVRWADRFFYRGCMFSNVPNLAVVFGYLNASWTLRADLNAAYVCRVLAEMERSGSAIAVPVLPSDHKLEEAEPFDFSSGYLLRGRHLMPKSATSEPWRLGQDYLADRKAMRGAVDDGVVQFRQVTATAAAPTAPV